MTIDELISEIQEFFPGHALSDNQREELGLLLEAYVEARLGKTLAKARAFAESIRGTKRETLTSEVK